MLLSSLFVEKHIKDQACLFFSMSLTSFKCFCFSADYVLLDHEDQVNCNLLDAEEAAALIEELPSGAVIIC